MKLVIKDIDGLDFPQEFKSPKYYIDTPDNHFATETVKSGDSYYSAEIAVNHFNFFIGANNSGKSRFMRGLLKLRDVPYLYFINEILYLDLFENLNLLYDKIEDKASLINFKLSFQDIQSKLPNEKSSIGNFSKRKSESLLKIIENFKKGIGNEIENDTLNYFKLIEEIINELWFSKKNKISKKTYIPVLRSLLKNDNLGKYAFIHTLKKVFFEGKEELNNINISTGLGLWDEVHRRQNTPEKVSLVEFASFLSTHFFEDKKVELLANTNKPELMSISIGTPILYRDVNTIGDGIQSLLLILFPIFMATENEVFYIEEPEMNLHPGFQRIFIETLLTNEFILNKNFKFFFTTHSNHFLDLTLRNDKVSFFQFEKVEEGRHLIKTKIKPNKETLDLLGVNNSSVFLANTSLWVEGPTDRLYLSKFLKLYCEEYKLPYLKEDIDFAFFEYGGGLITHYLFEEEIEFSDKEVQEKINSFALSNKIYLLADNDNPKENSEKEKREKSLTKLSETQSNFKYQNTNVKEIENLLPVKIVKDFMKELIGKEVTIDTKRIFFTKEDYESKGLGTFYEEQLLNIRIKNYDKNDSKNSMKSFREGNTLKTDYKKKLANFVINFKKDDGKTITYEDLIEDNENLKNIIEDLYRFIKNENSIKKI